jgi:hypothetical protein
LLAIIAAGIWTIYTYVTYQKGQQQLFLQQQQISKEQDELSLEQNKLLADTRRDSEEVSLKQQEFDLTQKNLLADTQKNTAETSLKQQKFGLEQNTLLAGTQRDLAKTSLAQQKFSLDQQRLTLPSEVIKSEAEAKLKKSQVDYSEQEPIKFDIKGDLKKIKIDESGMGEYNLKISATAQNLSDNEVLISYAVIEVFLGEINQERKVESIENINTPGTGGIIEWQHRDTRTYLSSWIRKDFLQEKNSYPCLYDIYRSEEYEIGRFALGRLQRLATLPDVTDFRIISRKSKWVGYNVHLFIGKCIDDHSMESWDVSESFSLSEIQ